MTASHDYYEERIARYRLLRHDDLPEAHKAEMRIAGIDPDATWNLIWSFEDEAAALAQLDREVRRATSWQSWKLVDAGSASTVRRLAIF